jgi:hypothetical protein
MKSRLIYGWLVIIIASHFSFGQDSLSLLFIGDVMQHGPQITSAYDATSKSYDYNDSYAYLRELMSSTDITIANLEYTLAGAPYTGYPMFSAPDESAVALQSAGVDILVTANNHTCDRRKKGVIRTIDVLDSIGLSHTGSFRNQAEKEFLYPHIIERNGMKLALLNYTYGTNGMPIENPVVVNLIDTALIKKDILKAKSLNVDKIIAFLHWGSEYTHKPSKEQVDIANLMEINGVDIIIGSHPHVLQPMLLQRNDSSEQFKVFSLGNFVSNQRTAPRDGGAMVRLDLVKENGITRIVKAGYFLTWVWLPKVGGKTKYVIMPASQYENDAETMDARSRLKMKTFIDNSRLLLNKENLMVPEYRYSAEAGWQLTELK